jgi:hypothetical protein
MWRVLVLAVALCCGACLGPKLEAHKIRSDEQEAIPYYLPRPYLIVSKNFAPIQPTGKATTPSKPDADKTRYAYQIVYLPDRCNQYGLRISRGIGTLQTRIELEDGWKFTGTDLKTDSKTPETIAAIGEPIAEIGKAFARGGTPADAEVALYDLFTGQCVFAWPSRDACAAPTSCPALE